MEQITIPILNLELNINKIAFNLCGVPVYWYAILIVFALSLAIFMYYKNDGKFGIYFDDIIDLSLILIPVSFICARLYYIIFHLEYYTTFERIISIKDGGLAIYGGIIGGGITAYIFCKKRKISFLDLTDYIIPYLALGQAIGRWGNFINVEAYGGETNLPWKMGIRSNTGITYVHPTFLYESLADFVIFLSLVKLGKNRKYSGQITFWYLILYSFIRFFIEGLRTDSLMIGNFRISQIVSALIFVGTILVGFYSNLSKKRKKQNNI